jgi:hypothetical protein
MMVSTVGPDDRTDAQSGFPEVQEAQSVMGRIVPLIVMVIPLAASCGCAGPGWYRAIGNLPGIASSDYAFYFFCSTASQVYQFTPPQVESSMMEALADLGFKVVEPPTHQPDGESLIQATAPDGRATRITITPQSAMTNVKVSVGHVQVGDYELSRTLLRRVALNFGTVMRAFTPMETTLPRRFNVSRGIPASPAPKPPEDIQGEGLRPSPGEAATNLDEPAIPGQVAPPTIPQTLGIPGAAQGFIPTRDFPNPPYMPYAPFPYYPIQ